MSDTHGSALGTYYFMLSARAAALGQWPVRGTPLQKRQPVPSADGGYKDKHSPLVPPGPWPSERLRGATGHMPDDCGLFRRFHTAQQGRRAWSAGPGNPAWWPTVETFPEAPGVLFQRESLMTPGLPSPHEKVVSHTGRLCDKCSLWARGLQHSPGRTDCTRTTRSPLTVKPKPCWSFWMMTQR